MAIEQCIPAMKQQEKIITLFSCQIQYYFTHVETNQSGGGNLGKTPDTPLSRVLLDPRQGLKCTIIRKTCPSNVYLLNPYLTNEFSHHYQLGKSTFILGVLGVSFNFYLVFR